MNGRSSNYTQKQWLGTMSDIIELASEAQSQQAVIFDKSEVSVVHVVVASFL